MKSRAVEAATLRPHTQAITMLHDKHTHSATATTYLPEFVQPETPVVVHRATGTPTELPVELAEALPGSAETCASASFTMFVNV